MMTKAKVKTKGSPSSRHYFYPGSKTFKNKYGITDFNAFRDKCLRDIEKATIVLQKEPLPDCFDSSYLCHIHKKLFCNTFEWAGQLRSVPFMFEDNTTAAMPKMKKRGWGNAFATGDAIQECLQELDHTLLKKGYLRGLSREEFIGEVIPIFLSLHHIHPFRVGNRRTQEIFCANLAKAADHQLNFSLIPRNRMMVALSTAEKDGDLKPLKNLFEDISNPKKVAVLQAFAKQIKKRRRKQHVYEQSKTPKPSNGMNFKVQIVEEHEDILIPEKQLAPLTEEELLKRVRESSCVCTSQEQIQHLSRVVYGNSQVLNKYTVDLIKNPEFGQILAAQIERAPRSIAKLAGINLCGLKNSARRDAENYADLLGNAMTDFAHAVKHAKGQIIKDYQKEQERCGKAVKMPSSSLQDLLELPRESQQTILRNSSTLQKELDSLVKEINVRFSSNEHKAVKNDDYKKLSKTLSVSEDKAKQITKIIQKTKEAHRLSQVCTRDRSGMLAIAS